MEGIRRTTFFPIVNLRLIFPSKKHTSVRRLAPSAWTFAASDDQCEGLLFLRKRFARPRFNFFQFSTHANCHVGLLKIKVICFCGVDFEVV